MASVLVNPPVLFHAQGSFRDALLAAGLEVVFPSRVPVPPDELRELVRQVEGVLASVEPYSRELLASSRLKVIARMGVGYDAVDVRAATDLGIVVCITPGTNEHSVAETALALLLGVYRGLPRRYLEVVRGTWTRKALPRLSGKTIGLVGLGRIGKAMVGRCQGLGLTVIAHDPFADAAFALANQVRLCTLEELLREADIVSLHLPAAAESTHLINRRTLAMMKSGSVLINTARGALVDEAALVEALESGHLLGAGLDVFQQEPLPTDSPLLKLENVLVLPHIAGLDHVSQEASSLMAAQCVIAVLAGRWPDGCVVNPEVRDRLRA